MRFEDSSIVAGVHKPKEYRFDRCTQSAPSCEELQARIRTYTAGTQFSGGLAAQEEKSGIIPRLFEDILGSLLSTSETDGKAVGGNSASARLTCTYLEIYNEVVRDLLREAGIPAPAIGYPLFKDR